MALEDLYDKLIALSVQQVRANSIMPRLINPDLAAGLARTGEVVNVNVPQPRTTSPVIPGPTPPGGVRPAPRSVPVTLDYWEDSAFTLTDREITSMSNAATYVPTELNQSCIAVADRVDGTVMQNYHGVYGLAGAAGVTPFATSLLEGQQAIGILAEQRCPLRDPNKHIVLDTMAYTNAIGLDAVQDASKYGSDYVIREGRIESALGFQWHMDQNSVRHTTGAAGTPLINNAAGYAAGVSSIAVDGFTTKPSMGDIFTIAGHTQTYTVLAATDLSGTNSTLTISPALQSAVVDNASVSFKASHVVNLAFQSSAFAFASRVADGSNMLVPDRGPIVRTWVDDDPISGSGLVLTLRISPEHYQTSFYLSCMWGSKLVDPRLATRIAG